MVTGGGETSHMFVVICLGCVDVWSTETGLEPIHQYQHLQRVHALDLSPDCPALASASGPEVRLDSTDEHGYWRSQSLIHLPKPVRLLFIDESLLNHKKSFFCIMPVVYSSFID